MSTVHTTLRLALAAAILFAGAVAGTCMGNRLAAQEPVRAARASTSPKPSWIELVRAQRKAAHRARQAAESPVSRSWASVAPAGGDAARTGSVDASGPAATDTVAARPASGSRSGFAAAPSRLEALRGAAERARSNEPGRPSIRILLERAAPIRGTSIRLGDVAEVRAADPEVRRMLLELEVGQRPVAGTVRALRAREILQQLNSAGFLATDVELIGVDGGRGFGAGDVILQPVTTPLREETIDAATRPAAVAWLRERSGPGFDFEVERIGDIPRTSVPPGRSGFELAARVDVVASRPNQVRTVLDVVVDGESFQEIEVAYRVRAFVDALHVVRPVEPGQPILPSNVVAKRIATTGLSNEVTTYAELAGKVAQRRLTPAQVLRSTDVVEPPLIRYGERVRIVSRAGSALIAVNGEALQDAAKGRPIKVRRLDGLDVVLGIAFAPGTVLVGSRR